MNNQVHSLFAGILNQFANDDPMECPKDPDGLHDWIPNGQKGDSPQFYKCRKCGAVCEQ